MGGAQTWGAPRNLLPDLHRGFPVARAKKGSRGFFPNRVSGAKTSESWWLPGGKSSAAMRGRGGTGGTRSETPLRALRVPRAKRGTGRRAGDSMGTPGRRGGSFISAPFARAPSKACCLAAPCLPAAAEPSGPPVLTFSSASRFVSSPCPFSPPCPLRRDSFWIRAERLLRGFRRG